MKVKEIERHFDVFTYDKVSVPLRGDGMKAEEGKDGDEAEGMEAFQSPCGEME